MSEINPSQSLQPNAMPQKDEPQDAYVQWLQESYRGLHEAVWQGHNVFWTTTSIFVPLIATATGYLITVNPADLTKGRIIMLYVLVMAVSWFWYGMFLVLRHYNGIRLKRLHTIEEQLNEYYAPRGSLRKFHYYSEDEHGAQQYGGRFSLKWFFLTLPVSATALMLILIGMTLANV